MMKDILININKIFESRVRLGTMSILIVNEYIDFNSLKEMLQITDGNLASHISVLEKNKYINVKKTFVGKKPNTSYSVTEKGKKAFKEHLDALERLIKNTI
jgi:DNA-binding MarR family transcriptional regulator